MKIDGMFFGNIMLCFRYNKISLKDVNHLNDSTQRENIVKKADGTYEFIDHCESVLYENVVLIKISDNCYIMYEDIKNSLENKLKSQPNKKNVEILPTFPAGIGKMFVDKSSLKQCYINSYEQENEQENVKKLKK